MHSIVILPAARADLLDQAEYFDLNGGEALGDRFVLKCEAAFQRLIQHPESGTRVRHRHAKLTGCRFILVPGFDQLMVYYRLTQSSIEIVRILHGARDVGAALEADDAD